MSPPATRKVLFQLPNRIITVEMPLDNVAAPITLDAMLTQEELVWIKETFPSSSIYSQSPPHTMALRRQTRSFLELAGEIRNQVYRHAFVPSGKGPVNGNTTKFPAIGLLLTNKQIHLEASSILYGDNTFTFGLRIDWKGAPEIQLYGFPISLPIWPAPTYHPLLTGLKINIAFTAGSTADLEAPEILRNQIQAMRDAYGSIWEDLNIYFRFKQGNLDELTFTMAWIKFRMLEPIAHPNCRVKVSKRVCPLVKWALESTLKERDLKFSLSAEQLRALSDSEEIANDVFETKKSYSHFELANRLAHGTVRALVPNHNGPPQTLFGTAPPVLQPPFATNLFHHPPAQPTTSNLFNNPPASQPTTSIFNPPFTTSAPFSLAPSQSSGVFSPPSAQHSTSNIFGPPPPPASSLFNNFPAQMPISPPLTMSSLFTTQQPASGLFSGLPSGNSASGLFAAQQPVSGGVFGPSVAQQPTSGRLFGNGGPSPQHSTLNGLFSSSLSRQPTIGGLFGGSSSGSLSGGFQSQQQPNSGGLFGGSSFQQSASGGLLGGPSVQQPVSGALSGASLSQQPISGRLFGGSPSQQPPSILFAAQQSRGGPLGSGIFGGLPPQQPISNPFSHGPIQPPTINLASNTNAPAPIGGLFNPLAQPAATNAYNPPAGLQWSSTFTFPAPPAVANLFNNIPPIPQPQQQLQNRRYRSWDFEDELQKNLSVTQAMQLLMRDNEMRVYAALDLPIEWKNLVIRKCAVLRAYFALMEAAGKIAALTRKLEDVEREKAEERDMGKEKGKGKGKGRGR